MNDNAPNFRLPSRQKPLQNIVITNMPKEVYLELHLRASRYNQKVSNYCRAVLEYAYVNKDKYEGIIGRNFDMSVAHPEKINIPLFDKKFKAELKHWNPFGNNTYPEIALSIIFKHIEVSSW